jgi:adenylate kinase family enzyme
VPRRATPDIEALIGDDRPRRVAVIGRAGAGKTTVALQLGQEFGLPVVHLDRLFWGPDWQPVEEATFAERQAAVIASEAWVIDGGYLWARGWTERLARADLVVVVEAPLLVCLARIIRRSLRPSLRGGARRPDLPDGCSEQFSPEFIWWTLTWRSRARGPLAMLDERGGRVARWRT